MKGKEPAKGRPPRKHGRGTSFPHSLKGFAGLQHNRCWGHKGAWGSLTSWSPAWRGLSGPDVTPRGVVDGKMLEGASWWRSWEWALDSQQLLPADMMQTPSLAPALCPQCLWSCKGHKVRGRPELASYPGQPRGRPFPP